MKLKSIILLIVLTSVGNAENLTVDGNLSVLNNVGIGTTNPTEKIQVQGNIRLSGSIHWDWPGRAIFQFRYPK